MRVFWSTGNVIPNLWKSNTYTYKELKLDCSQKKKIFDAEEYQSYSIFVHRLEKTHVVFLTSPQILIRIFN